MTKYNFEKMSYSDGLALVEKARQGRTVKRADSGGIADTIKNLLVDNQDILKTIGVGAGIGGALGYGSSFMRSPERRKPGRSAMTGAVLGGLGGLGYGAATRGLSKAMVETDVEKIKAVKDRMKSIKDQGVFSARNFMPMISMPGIDEGIAAGTIGAIGSQTAIPGWMDKLIYTTAAAGTHNKPELAAALRGARSQRVRFNQQSVLRRLLSKIGIMRVPDAFKNRLGLPSNMFYRTMAEQPGSPSLARAAATRGALTGVGALAAYRLLSQVGPRAAKNWRQDQNELRNLKLVLEELNKGAKNE